MLRMRASTGRGGAGRVRGDRSGSGCVTELRPRSGSAQSLGPWVTVTHFNGPPHRECGFTADQEMAKGGPIRAARPKKARNLIAPHVIRRARRNRLAFPVTVRSSDQSPEFTLAAVIGRSVRASVNGVFSGTAVRIGDPRIHLPDSSWLRDDETLRYPRLFSERRGCNRRG